MQQQQQQQAHLGAPSLSSLRFDMGAYQADLRQSVGPGQYVLAPMAPHCRPCLAADSRLVLGTSGDSTCATQSLVDVESELQNINRRATLSPDGLYRGDGGGPTACGRSISNGVANNLAAFPQCDGLPAVDTRLANPPCTLRGTGWNRWEWLCRDPQERVIIPFDAYIDTSIVVKDNHRPHVARPVDPTLAMPPGKADRDAAIGAPQWIPQMCDGVGAVDEPPNMMWRSCAEVAKITDGA